MKRSLHQCPVCDTGLKVTELTCPACETRLKGEFPPPPLARLPREHQAFVETFLRCRGVIRDVERVLGISYPTVRARLDAAVSALETLVVEDSVPDSQIQRRRAILNQVEDGTLTAAEAVQLLAQL